MEKTLTKSRFKLAIECPVKLYYTGKKEYLNSKLDDPFLEALAEGGFQVGELAKEYFPDGQMIDTLDADEALSKTNLLLSQENAVIFEAAIRYLNHLIRIDVLEKKGNKINLIEVKAKSADDTVPASFFTQKQDGLSSVWKPYLYDVAFQKHVLKKAFPQYTVNAYLMLADKTQKATVDGLNQRFLLQKDKNGRTRVIVTRHSDTGGKILRQCSANEACEWIYSQNYTLENRDLSFEEYIQVLADAYVNDRKIDHPIGDYCKDCEFNPDSSQLKPGFKSGFRECWKEKTRLKDPDFDEPLMFELWNNRKKRQFIENNQLLLRDLNESDFIDKKAKESPGLTSVERQQLQISKFKNHDTSPYIDREGIAREIRKWKFPWHMIDFETTMVAIPFYAGRRPYEMTAFQFSHHIIEENGQIRHAGQYLNTTPGVFPNYDFLRCLKKELENDEGSIFRYAAHENTVLNKIYEQLCADEPPQPDKDELLAFIRTITYKKDAPGWTGPRAMIDLLQIVKQYYYHPSMKGSNSIKKVLPAVLESQFIQEHFSGRFYGSTEVKSLNYENWEWIKKGEDGTIISPYHLLPPLFEGIDNDLLDTFLTGQELADGGAAMTAYARMQFTEMNELERKKLAEGLLRYCELDTFAMVLLVEYLGNV